jgi:hypothetical protein
MRTLEVGIICVLSIVVGILAGLLYTGRSRPVSLSAQAATPTPCICGAAKADLMQGYSVGPGWQTTATPAPIFAAADATPTSVWLQPDRDIPCDQADAIARDAATHSCEALWAAERDDPHVQKGIQTEPGVQVSRKHDYGRYTYMLFSQALIIWRNTNDDGRIGVFSPHGCWHGLPESLQPPATAVP